MSMAYELQVWLLWSEGRELWLSSSWIFAWCPGLRQKKKGQHWGLPLVPSFEGLIEVGNWNLKSRLLFLIGITQFGRV